MERLYGSSGRARRFGPWPAGIAAALAGYGRAQGAAKPDACWWGRTARHRRRPSEGMAVAALADDDGAALPRNGPEEEADRMDTGMEGDPAAASAAVAVPLDRDRFLRSPIRELSGALVVGLQEASGHTGVVAGDFRGSQA